MSVAPAFNWQDPMDLQEQISEDERGIQAAVHSFCQTTLLPRVTEAFREERQDRELFRQMGEHGMLGSTITGYDCAGINYTAMGLMAREIEAVDSGYRSAWSVQSSLVMFPINEFGSAAQKAKFLPQLASGELIGSFALMEPNADSDPASMTTRAIKVDGGYLLSGEKTWITNAPFADVIVVWAKLDDSNRIGGFLVERGSEGLDTPRITGKLSLRASCTGMVQLNKCFVSEGNVLPGAIGLKAPFSCLNNARLGIAWGVIGAAESCYRLARNYTLQRQQFGRSLAATQLVQAKLTDMATDIALSLQGTLRATRMKDEGKLPHELISMLKRSNTGKACMIARMARDMLGGNGIVDEYHVMRHLCNLETVVSYEGTYDVHSLIVGRAITGLSAF